MPVHDPNTITAATDLAPHLKAIIGAAFAAVIALATRRTHAK